MTNSTGKSRVSTQPPGSSVVIVGAGIGGLTAALLLAARGLNVTVLERADSPGGKLRPVRVGSALVDCGPTVFTMRDVFEGIFAEAGERLDAHLRLAAPEILARHAWSDGEVLDLFSDQERSVEAIARFAGAAEGERYRAFCARARSVFTALDQPFIRAPRPSLGGLIRAGTRDRRLFAISPFQTLSRALAESFADPRLRQLFGRYATYCGSSPYLCPATLMLVAHVEQAGVWLVEGGMHRLAVVVEALARARGATFRYGVDVRSIDVERGRAAAVTLATGERLEAGAVLCAGDVAALAAGLLGEGVRKAAAAPGGRSLSAVTFALTGRAAGFPLARHNVFFSRDYPAEFDDIFKRGRVPREPTVYVCAEDRDGSPKAPDGTAERLFCIVNAPADGDTHIMTDTEMAQCEASTFRTLARCGLTIEAAPDLIKRRAPSDFHRLFPATGGALYGAASHGWMASFRRTGVRSRVPGLYLCGGSVHPGPGLPMAALSGQMAAASLIADLASTRRSRPAAMLGGMSTA